MKRFLCFIVLLLPVCVHAQELYVSTEPASNMPARSLGFRVTNRFFKMEHEGVTGMRIEPELMWGISKKLMVHVTGLASNQMQPSLRFEGGSIYAKYRFLSSDDLHSHFRMAAYVKGSVIDNPFVPAMREQATKPFDNRELDLEGGASGVSGGIIATQLLHKLAVSATLGYNRFMNNTKDKLPAYMSANAVNYSLSAGYLLLPRSYRSYEQTNLNLYIELLGKANTDAVSRNHYMDVAPAIQFIFNSATRLDFSYRTQLFGGMSRNVFNTFTLRFEHNIFNISTKKK
ncbi:transporter [Chitinophaga rhizophila]|uniref:Transporter n=1 Tax=Chitinophaga rhizophila TaxID=2866212 RepID=A0ABS7GBW6_9BACT|nr:transporter [Chitinophaga rhizophila]MBW8685158.1 transporter [Chitinophaga rhizophila]